MFVKIFETVDFGQNFEEKSISVKIFENLNFVQVTENFDFCEKFLKITILVKIFKNPAL